MENKDSVSGLAKAIANLSIFFIDQQAQERLEKCKEKQCSLKQMLISLQIFQESQSQIYMDCASNKGGTK